MAGAPISLTAPAARCRYEEWCKRKCKGQAHYEQMGLENSVSPSPNHAAAPAQRQRLHQARLQMIYAWQEPSHSVTRALLCPAAEHWLKSAIIWYRRRPALAQEAE